MKTLEFALSLSCKQRATIAQWQEDLRWVWNQALEQLIELETFSIWDKFSSSRVPCSPLLSPIPGRDFYGIPVLYRWLREDERWICAPYCQIASKRSPYRMSCPVTPTYKEPQLSGESPFTLAAAFAHKRHPDKPWLKAIPANFIRGVTASLALAWQQYRKGERGKPKFKGKGNPLETLVNNDAKILRRNGNKIRIPNLGELKVKDLTERFGDANICTLKICCRPSGYYLQVTGDISTKEPKPATKAIGIAFAKNTHHITSYGGVVAPSQFMLKAEQKLKRLQRKLSRQTYLGKNWQKTKQAIAQLHERIRLQRRNYNHKLASFIVQANGAIAVQQVRHGVKPRPEPKIVHGEYAPNGAEMRSAFNRQIVDLGRGQFVEFLAAKASHSGREFIQVSATDKTASPQAVAHNIRSELTLVKQGRIDPQCGGSKPLKEEPSSPVQEESTQVEQSRNPGSATSTDQTSTSKGSKTRKSQALSTQTRETVPETATLTNQVLANASSSPTAVPLQPSSNQEMPTSASKLRNKKRSRQGDAVNQSQVF